jgi:hypothetical protein
MAPGSFVDIPFESKSGDDKAANKMPMEVHARDEIEGKTRNGKKTDNCSRNSRIPEQNQNAAIREMEVYLYEWNSGTLGEFIFDLVDMISFDIVDCVDDEDSQ